MIKRHRDRPISRQRDTSKTVPQSIQSEMKAKAIALGLPEGETVLPEQTLSPNYGDPTAVDDRPFATAF